MHDNVVMAARACVKQGCRTVPLQPGPCTLYSRLGRMDGAEHAAEQNALLHQSNAIQQLVLMSAHKGEACTYLQKGIALHIISLMHEPASVAGDSFPQVLHGAAGQSMRPCNSHLLTVYCGGISLMLLNKAD